MARVEEGEGEVRDVSVAPDSLTPGNAKRIIVAWRGAEGRGKWWGKSSRAKVSGCMR